MQIKASSEDGFHIIRIYGDVDASSSIVLDKAVQKAIADKEKKILIDGTSLNYISSAGLGVFMSYVQDFKDHEISFAIYGLTPKVKNVFQILGLDQLLPIVESKEEAFKL